MIALPIYLSIYLSIYTCFSLNTYVHSYMSSLLHLLVQGFNKPFYAAAESHKFTRLYPLNQQDFPAGSMPFVSLLHPRKDGDEDNDAAFSSIGDGNPCVDYTPSKYITLLFTELGVLTPSAVSDELIRLYH